LTVLGSPGGLFSESAGWTLVTLEHFEKNQDGVQDGRRFMNIVITFFIIQPNGNK